MSGKLTLSAGLTSPFAVAAPEVNQLLNSEPGTVQVLLASLGKTVCPSAASGPTDTKAISINPAILFELGLIACGTWIFSFSGSSDLVPFPQINTAFPAVPW